MLSKSCAHQMSFTSLVIPFPFALMLEKQLLIQIHKRWLIGTHLFFYLAMHIRTIILFNMMACFIVSFSTTQIHVNIHIKRVSVNCIPLLEFVLTLIKTVIFVDIQVWWPALLFLYHYTNMCRYIYIKPNISETVYFYWVCLWK